MEKIPWYQDPALAHIDQEKLEFLQNLVFDSQKLNSNEMLPLSLINITDPTRQALM